MGLPLCSLLMVFGTPLLVITVAGQSTVDVDLDQFCEACVVDTGAGYYQHPLRCDVFVHCAQSGDNRTVMATLKECPRGLYWSQNDLTCRHHYEVNCPQDPCKQPGRIAYREIFSCAGYYICVNGSREVARTCCKDKFRFDEISQKCVPDEICRSSCHSNFVRVPNSETQVPICTRKAVADDVTVYLQEVHGYFYRMPCPRGTVFSTKACYCVRGRRKKIVAAAKCDPFIYLPFDIDWNDYSKHPKGVGANSLEIIPIEGAVGGTAAYFDGTSSATVWALNNMHFGSNFTITFRFRSSTQNNGQFALVDNSDCEKSATFGVALDQTAASSVLYGGFILEDNSVVRLNATLKRNQWHDVTLMKSGSRVELWVDGYMTAKTGHADIKRLDCSLTLGRGTNLDPFVGFIDDFRFYKCTTPKYLRINIA